MGAPCDIAAAYARQSSFGGEPGVSEPHATSVHTVLDCQQADYREHNHHYPYTAARDMLADPQHNLHFSLSGNMSDCSETLRADSVSGMELQESYMFLDDDLVAGEAMIEPPQHDTETSSDTVPVPPSSFKPEQLLNRHQAVQWQQNLQKASNLSHSPHHHIVAAPVSCLKQRPQEFSFWFGNPAQLPEALAASRKPFSGRIKSIEGKQGLQQSTQVHVGSKRSRRVCFD